jgi:hypothetical protein
MSLKKKTKHNKNKKYVKLSNRTFIDICKFEKGKLKNYLKNELSKYYEEVISEDGFLFANGNEIVVTAHLDTTPHLEYGKRMLVKDVYEYIENNKHVVKSPQGIGGDDRCGVYMILEILKRTDLRPTIVFCEDEEIGCVGSNKFTNTKYIKLLENKYFIIELDRRGSNDIVFYDDTNEDFQSYVEEVTGYEINWGTCSDISYLCPACGISGVNLSCGYYNEHHKDETVVLEEMERTLNTTINLIKEGIKNNKQFEYIEKVYTKSYGYYNYDGISYNNNDIRTYNNYIYKSYKYNKYETYNDLIDNVDTKYYLCVEFDNDYGDVGQFLSAHPNCGMNDVTDFQEWTSLDNYVYIVK